MGTDLVVVMIKLVAMIKLRPKKKIFIKKIIENNS